MPQKTKTPVFRAQYRYNYYRDEPEVYYYPMLPGADPDGLSQVEANHISATAAYLHSDSRNILSLFTYWVYLALCTLGLTSDTIAITVAFIQHGHIRRALFDRLGRCLVDEDELVAAMASIAGTSRRLGISEITETDAERRALARAALRSVYNNPESHAYLRAVAEVDGRARFVAPFTRDPWWLACGITTFETDIADTTYSRARLALQGVRSLLPDLSPGDRLRIFREWRMFVGAREPGTPFAIQPYRGPREWVFVQNPYGVLRRSLTDMLARYGVVLPCRRCGTTDCNCPTLYHFRMEELRFSPSTLSSVPADHQIPRYVGLELEICGLDRPRLGDMVCRTVDAVGGEVKYDGSLPDGGFEIALPPIAGDAAIDRINSVCAALDKAGAWVDGRAGGHVHVDARDMSDAQFHVFCALWYLLEQTVFDTCAPGRAENTYCQPWRGRPLPDLSSLPSYVRTPSEAFRNYPGDWERYSAINLLNRHEQRGTIEFRLFGGTVQAARAIRNASVASRIVHAAMTWGPEKLASAITTLGPRELLSKIIGPETDKIVREYDGRPEYSIETSEDSDTYSNEDLAQYWDDSRCNCRVCLVDRYEAANS